MNPRHDSAGEIALSSHDVHVWNVNLDVDQRWARRVTNLSSDEIARADRYRFEKDRRRYVVRRGCLRLILGLYLNRPARDLQFSYGEHGKPFLAVDAGRPPLRFNSTHSHETALIGVTRGREIGIDIERVCPERADRQIARRFFSKGEVSALSALPAHQWRAGFFNCWTRKEAYIKARGEGLSMPLDQFEVSLAPNDPARLLATAHDADASAHWSLYQLKPGVGYVGALAVEGTGCRIECFDAAILTADDADHAGGGRGPGDAE